MSTTYAVGGYLQLVNGDLDVSGFTPDFTWDSVTRHTSVTSTITDIADDGFLHKDVDTFDFNSTTYSGFFLIINGKEYSIYGNNTDGFFIPYEGGDLDAIDLNGTDLASPIGLANHNTPNQDSIVCLIAGTIILTADHKSVPVESLLVGQQLSVSSGGSRKVKFIFKQRVRNPGIYFDKSSVMPVRILQGALGADSPSSDLLVSPSHALLIDGNLVEAHALINGSSIYQETSWDGELEYYHIELEDHSVIYANNVPAETFIDNVSRATFDNYDEYLALYSEAEDMQELEYPRAKSSRQLPKALKQKLVDRAEILYPELVIKKVA